MISTLKFGCLNKPFKAWLTGAVAVTAVLLLTGCGSLGGSLLRPIVTREPIPEVIPAVTNRFETTSNGVVTVHQVITPETIVTNWVTTTNFVVNPAISGALKTAQAVNSVNPFPFAGVLNAVLGLAVTGLGFYARVKSQRAALVPAIIQGVEVSNSPEVKGNIATIARAMGVERQLNQVVKAVT